MIQAAVQVLERLTSDGAGQYARILKELNWFILVELLDHLLLILEAEQTCSVSLTTQTTWTTLQTQFKATPFWQELSFTLGLQEKTLYIRMLHVLFVTLLIEPLHWWYLQKLCVHNYGQWNTMDIWLQNTDSKDFLEYACLDQDPEFVPGESRTTFGVTIHLVEASCNTGIACPPYHAGKEVACVICTK